MKRKSITKDQYNKIGKMLKKNKIDLFGKNNLRTICKAGDDYSIIIFDNERERDVFMNNWYETVKMYNKRSEIK
jgi:predicted ribosome-associated RNA-binding protein Tma20